MDINHPQSCLRLWRDEADDLLGKLTLVPDDMSAGIQAVINTLRRCADQLENRLRWSGMLDR